MTKLILDIETTYTKNEDGKTNPSPYLTTNRLVSVGLKNVDSGYSEYLFFNHSELPDNQEQQTAAAALLQKRLTSASLVIGHNLKFDMAWLYECGFKYDGSLYDTMIFEYVAAKGRKPLLGLADCAERYGLTPKKDILKEHFAKGLNTDEVPIKELEEYGLGDIETTYELYQHQRKRYTEEEEIRTMWPAMKLSMETLEVLIDIERAGIPIDLRTLEDVEITFKNEKAALEQRMRELVRDVMGDTKINLASPADMSMVVYGRKVKDKKFWAETFNIGTEQRGAVKKAKYNRRYKDSEFKQIIRDQTEVLYKTDAMHCKTCDGKGTIQKYKKDKVLKRTGEVIKGEPHKKPNRCPDCKGDKVLYIPNGRRAGFAVRPISSEYATINGFSTDKTTIDELIALGGLSYDAEEFLRALQRVNALDTYLTSFVEGIKRSTIQATGSIALNHPNYNQCVTATGRLSSSNPNWQNQPRGGTFPIRKAIVSRWEGGVLYPTDFAALEYRVAVLLAACPAGLKSLIEKKDRHEMSALYMFNAKPSDFEDQKKWKEVRQNAKKHTFSPLFSGVGQTEQSRAYADAFFKEHTGIAKWHEGLGKEALTKKQIMTPSGRIFAFPEVRRNDNGKIIGITQITNYPVQSFSADLVWSVIIPLWREMKSLGLKSKLIMQTHDDVVPDVHPEEKEVMLGLIKKHFYNATAYLTERFKYVTNVPIGFEISQGSNLLDKKTIYETNGKLI
jgi:DNA polymerase-1